MDENLKIENQISEEEEVIVTEEAVEEETAAEETISETKENAEPTEDKKAALKKKVLKEIKEWVVSLAVAALVVVVIQSFLFRIIRVDGASMNPTLLDGERLFVTVADIKFGSVDRNDVVICHYPNRGMTYFVKRIVAVPGDKVYREYGVTHVVYTDENGNEVDVALDERYILYNLAGSPDDYAPYTLGEDEYFAVGDNRYNSHDSRDWNDRSSGNDVGPISKKMIVGRVSNVIWPLSDIRAIH